MPMKYAINKTTRQDEQQIKQQNQTLNTTKN